MKITILQIDIKWGLPNANHEAVESLLDVNPGSDIYVLPEMWATGFAISPKELSSEDIENGSLNWMVLQAKKRGSAISGSILAKTENNEFKNRHYFVMPDGTYKYYDKHHLFTYGSEGEAYTQGNERVVVQYKGMRFLLQTCYDLRFPVWQRNKEDYDTILLAANWPESRQAAWQILIRARAIENQCFVIGANRVGKDSTCTYIGRSAIIDPLGRAIVQAKGNYQQALTADISMEDLIDFRSKFPVLKDRDIFNY